MTIEGDSHELKPVPDDVIGRAVKDKVFRKQVFERRGNKDTLNAYLKDEGLTELDDQAYAVIKGLDSAAVDRVLYRADHHGAKEADAVEILAS